MLPRGQPSATARGKSTETERAEIQCEASPYRLRPAPPRELENHEGAQHEQQNLLQLRVQKDEKRRAWKDFCEEMSHSRAEGHLKQRIRRGANPVREIVLEFAHLRQECDKAAERGCL
jgi:hypothetical protein